MIEWLAPALAFAVINGAIGIATRVALVGMGFGELVLWTSAAYVLVAGVLLAADAPLSWNAGAGWAALSGILACAALLLLYRGLSRGPASKVMPVTAGYPLVSAVLAVMVLSETVSFGQVVGIALVVGGVIQLTRRPSRTTLPTAEHPRSRH